MSVTLSAVLGKLPTAKKSGKGYIACCPAHEDRSPSLSITEGDGGKVLVKCHAGCTVEAVCAAVGLRLSDLMPNVNGKPKPSRNGKGKIVATYGYRDEQGNLLMQALRYEPKTFKQRKPCPSGDGWIWSVKDVRVVPYRLPDVFAEPSRPVVVVEGEKDADNLHTIGVLATCNVGGAGKWTDEHSAFLKGRHVIVLPDNDDAGRDHADKVARSLHGIAASVRIVNLPGLPAKGDVSDWLAAGGTKEKLAELAKAVPIWNPTAEPAPKPDPKPAVFVPFPTGELPSPAREFVESASTALACDPSYVALPLIAALAAAIGNVRRVKLKGSWCEPCVFWTVIIGESGTLKSPAMEVALDFVRRKQSKEYRDYANEQKEHEQGLLRHEADMADWKRQGRKKNEPPPEKPEPPVWKQRLAEDTTVEALAVMLENQPRGVMVARDELSGWLNSFDAYKSARGADVAHWLSMHRAGSMLVNRKTGRNVIRVPRAAVGVTGGVQPKTLAAALAGRYSGGDDEALDKPESEHFANGLAARLLLAYPPRIPKVWTDADIAEQIQDAMARRFDELFGLECPDDQNGELIPVDLPFTREARRRYIAFYNQNAKEQCQLSSELASAWSKIESYAARFALLFELVADPAATSVGMESVESAIAVAQWFAEEAARIYDDLGGGSDSAEAKQKREDDRLRNWIEHRGGVVTAREVRQGCRWLRESDAAELALNELVRKGDGVWENSPKDRRGQPTRYFRLALSTVSTVNGNSENPDENGNSVDVDTVDISENVFSDPDEPDDSPLDLDPVSDRVEVAI